MPATSCACIEPGSSRRRAERALAAVVKEAYVKGVSTRKVDDLVRALGMEGIPGSEVSRICKDLDSEVEAFRSRPIEGEHPYLGDRLAADVAVSEAAVLASPR